MQYLVASVHLTRVPVTCTPCETAECDAYVCACTCHRSSTIMRGTLTDLPRGLRSMPAYATPVAALASCSRDACYPYCDRRHN